MVIEEQPKNNRRTIEEMPKSGGGVQDVDK
jgi:hypothetical protein